MEYKKETTFVTKNNYELKAKKLSDIVDVSKFIGGDDLFIISYTNSTNINGDFCSSTTDNKQRIVNKECLEGIIASPHLYNELIKECVIKNPVCLVKNDFTNNYKEYGYNECLMDLDGKIKKELLDGIYKAENKVYYLFSDASYEFVQFIENGNYLRVCSDSSGNLFCEPQVYDYIGANLDNGNYHLDSLIEYLMKRDDVSFITNSQSRDCKKSAILRCPLSGDEAGVDKIIDDIPGYNATEESTETITVVFRPNTGQIKEMLNWDRDVDKNCWNLDNYVIRKMLACEQFRKFPIEEVAPAVPKRKFKS